MQYQKGIAWDLNPAFTYLSQQSTICLSAETHKWEDKWHMNCVVKLDNLITNKLAQRVNILVECLNASN